VNFLNTIKFMKEVCQYTGTNDKDFSGIGFKIIIDPNILLINNYVDICQLSVENKKNLRLCCIIYILSNSKSILKTKTVYEIIFSYSSLLENILSVLSNILDAANNPDIESKLRIYRGIHFYAHYFWFSMESRSTKHFN